MYYACYWRIPLEGTPEKSHRIELLDLHDVNIKHGHTRTGDPSQRPVAYFEEADKASESILHNRDEALGLVLAVKHFEIYVSQFLANSVYFSI